MKSILKGNVFFLVRLLLKLNPVSIFFVLGLKASFILFQVSSIWVLVSWIGGSVVQVIQDFVGSPSSSYVYPAMSAFFLVFAAISAALSRYVGLKCVSKVELCVNSVAKEGDVTVADYKNLTKLLLSMMDALIPSLFILVVVIIWGFIYPMIIPLICVLLVFLLQFFRRGVGVSAKKLKPLLSKVKAVDYVHSEQRLRFYSILMLPQYVIIAIYTLIAFFVLFLSVAVRSYLDGGSIHDLGLLLIVSALALMQLKSFVTVLVRSGAYNSSAVKIASLLKSV